METIRRMTRKVAPPPNASGLFFAREHRGMSQDQLAKASGALKPMISKLESGSRELTRAWAERFAGPLGLSAIRIVFWDKVGPPPPHGEVEAEYDVPNPTGRAIQTEARVDTSARRSSKTASPRQKPLNSSVVKLYLEEWRKFMGADPAVAAKALGLDAEQYDELEEFPFRLTIDQMGRVSQAIGVHPHQLFFPVTAAQLTDAQKKLPAGLTLLKRRA